MQEPTVRSVVLLPVLAVVGGAVIVFGTLVGQGGGSAPDVEPTSVTQDGGMNDSNMPGMDHSKMPGMDHSKMPGMDHSKMPGMDH